ncbi:MAG: PIG-L family deacetylase [Rhodanobacter sp.]
MPSFSAASRLLVVAPHPDDETIATGVLVQQVRAMGGEVHILLLTNGDNNPWPQRWLEHRLLIGTAARKRWGQRRYAEMLQALQCLQVPQQALQTMGWPDMGVAELLLRDGVQAAASIALAIDRFQPTLIALPSIEDRHPDHGAAHVLVQLALAGRTDTPRQLAYLVHGDASRTSVAELHASPAQQAGKIAALEAHHTQMALSGRRMRRLAAADERYRAVSTRLPAPGMPLPWRPPFWLRPWLRLSVASASGTHSWRWQDAPLQRDDRGDYHLPDEAGSTSSLRFVKLSLSLRTPWIFDRWGWRKA